MCETQEILTAIFSVFFFCLPGKNLTTSAGHVCTFRVYVRCLVCVRSVLQLDTTDNLFGNYYRQFFISKFTFNTFITGAGAVTVCFVFFFPTK